MKQDCKIFDWGMLDYSDAWQRQKDLHHKVVEDDKSHALVLCEHPAVLTLGSIARRENILFSEKDLEEKGVKVFKIDRGGEVTLHSPGQLVVYPIFNLKYLGKDLRAYLKQLEQVAIDLLQEFDIVANSISSRRGVWVGDKKIGSIGVGVKKWVSFHGLALNVNNDLGLFSLIRPCGLDVKMTSISDVKNKSVDFNDVKNRLVYCFSRIFNLETDSLE